jgi:hypothetical protein
MFFALAGDGAGDSGVKVKGSKDPVCIRSSPKGS